MKFVSTRGKSPALKFSQAIVQGLAPDGGLYIPEKFPHFDLAEFSGDLSVAEVGEKILKPFLAGDSLESQAREICQKALNFPIPLKKISADSWVLELFHGPTAAFKDVGARFLAECLSRVPESQPRTVLVATSGDTGGAVAAAFFEKPGIEVVILYPKGKVSPRQEKQLTAWGKNIHGLSVQGNFDDCQRIVKEAFQDSSMQQGRTLLSSNSISIGRLLPQSFYYAWASLQRYKQTGKKPGFIIPTGNLGNAMAAFWAQKMGFPVGPIILASNANRAIPDYFQSGEWKGHATVATLANAMDVGHPSNMERLLSLYPELADLKKISASISVKDKEISETISEGIKKYGEIWCPHTATAVYAREHLPAFTDTAQWILVSTAHPSKFEWIVEPLIGKKVEIPAVMEAILKMPSKSTEIQASLAALKTAFLNLK